MNSTEQGVLALDAHGGDFGPAVTVPAALDVLAAQPGTEILLCGLPDKLRPLLDQNRSGREAELERLHVVAATHALASDASPVAALRRGQGSSLWLALEQLAEGRASACISAGSTAAILALGVKLIGLLEGIERPALMSRIPSASGHTTLLDLGANLKVSASQLVQFALMGSLVYEIHGAARPRVALLNVGHEDSKGGALVKQAHAVLKTMPINYTGFIEGHDIFAGKADVAVCDGFSGNLILKSGEGLARMLLGQLDLALHDGLPARFGALLAKPALKRSLARFAPSKHNGAPLLGLKGVVIKSHGNAERDAMRYAILEGALEAQRQVPALIETMIRDHFKEVDV